MKNFLKITEIQKKLLKMSWKSQKFGKLLKYMKIVENVVKIVKNDEKRWKICRSWKKILIWSINCVKCFEISQNPPKNIRKELKCREIYLNCCKNLPEKEKIV